jgi:TIGR03009 family protein
MRLYGLVLTALILASLPARSQQQPPARPPAAPPPTDKKLDEALQNWEKAMKDVKSLAASIVRIDKDRTFDKTTKLVGGAWYLKAGTGASALNLARLEMRLENKKYTGGKDEQFEEKFICTGTYLYQFLPSQKEVKVYELPKPKPGQVAEDNFLSFLFGMKAEEAKRRYNLKLAKEDKNYVYVDISPRFAADRADFQRARLVLNRNTFLPRQLWFEHANGNEVMWDVPNLQKDDGKVDRRWFDAPQAPKGWKLVPVSQEKQKRPDIVRPSAPKK